MTPSKLADYKKALEHSNLHQGFQQAYPLEKWNALPERDKCAIYLGYAQGAVNTVKSLTEHKKSNDNPLVIILELLMEALIKDLQDYHAYLLQQETSGNVTIFGAN